MNSARRYQIFRSEGPEPLAQDVAQRLLARFAACRSRSQEFCLAVSGGRISQTLFRAMAAAAPSSRAGQVHFFWADERCVPPDHPESNFRLANELYFQPVRIPPEQIHRIQGEIIPAEAARQAADEVRRVCARGGEPRFDLVLLGMGEDGHVASLFPGEEVSILDDPAIYRPVTAVKPPPLRITLGYGPLVNATEVWVLVSGAGKEKALRESLASPSTPLGRVLAQRRETIIFTDVKWETSG